MRSVTIEILNPIWSRFQNSQDAILLQPAVSYKTECWIDTGFGKRKKESKGSLVNAKTLRVLTGLLNRLEAYCDSKKIDLIFKGNEPWVKHAEPRLPSKTFRPEQLQLIHLATEAHRGVITAPTGLGKTVIMMGLVSCYPNKRFLILAHTTSLTQQLMEEFKDHEFSVSQYSNGSCPTTDIVVSTRQTFVNVTDKQLLSSFDGVIIDECHSGAGEGEYEKILTRLECPLRFGFTATLPNEERKRLGLEGLLGPVVGKVTIEKARELQILAEPKVHLLTVPFNDKIAEEGRKSYRKMYEVGIVYNRARNRVIMEEAKRLNDEGISVVVFINQLPHGDELVHMGGLLGVESVFIEGITAQADRETVKRSLESKKVMCVISSSIWREGINVKSLGAIILAAGLKSEVATIQSAGRALRRTLEKDTAYIVDLLDPYRYLAEHTIQRISTYTKLGWL